MPLRRFDCAGRATGSRTPKNAGRASRTARTRNALATISGHRRRRNGSLEEVGTAAVDGLSAAGAYVYAIDVLIDQVGRWLRHPGVHAGSGEAAGDEIRNVA